MKFTLAELDSATAELEKQNKDTKEFLDELEAAQRWIEATAWSDKYILDGNTQPDATATKHAATVHKA